MVALTGMTGMTHCSVRSMTAVRVVPRVSIVTDVLFGCSVAVVLIVPLARGDFMGGSRGLLGLLRHHLLPLAPFHHTPMGYQAEQDPWLEHSRAGAEKGNPQDLGRGPAGHLTAMVPGHSGSPSASSW